MYSAAGPLLARENLKGILRHNVINSLKKLCNSLPKLMHVSLLESKLTRPILTTPLLSFFQRKQTNQVFSITCLFSCPKLHKIYSSLQLILQTNPARCPIFLKVKKSTNLFSEIDQSYEKWGRQEMRYSSSIPEFSYKITFQLSTHDTHICLLSH